jgi:hypothetical protein
VRRDTIPANGKPQARLAFAVEIVRREVLRVVAFNHGGVRRRRNERPAQHTWRLLALSLPVLRRKRCRNFAEP